MIFRANSKAFALLMTLVLLLIAGCALSSLARRSITGAVECDLAASELKRRWAVKSAAPLILVQAEKLLDSSERGNAQQQPNAPKTPYEQTNSTAEVAYANGPSSQRHINCTLAGIDYEFLIIDQQAALNVNRYIGLESAGECRSVLKKILQRSRPRTDSDIEVHLRAPDLSSTKAGKRGFDQRVGGFGQLFDNALPADLLGEGNVDSLARQLTCWGDGKLNIRRASDYAIHQLCDKPLGRREVSALLAARNRDPYQKLSEIKSQLDSVDAAAKAEMSEYLCDSSQCHAIWTLAKDVRGSWYYLLVGESAVVKYKRDDGRVIRKNKLTKLYEFQW